MRVLFVSVSLLVSAQMMFCQFPSQIKNVIIMVQENRTPDNLFHFLTPACPLSANSDMYHACTPPNVTNKCYDIAPCGLSNQHGAPVAIKLAPVTLSASVYPSHSHQGAENMCDHDPVTFKCRNDGAWKTAPKNLAYSYVANTAVTNSDGSQGHILDPYLTLAKQYGWANYMFQTNQGGSYVAHQFLFSGTSALSAQDDANATFVAENFFFSGKEVDNMTGCLAAAGAGNHIISPVQSTPPSDCTLYANGTVKECPIANTALVYPTNPVGTFCVTKHQSMADVLDSHGITWKYYSPWPGTLWNAPNANKNVCEPQFETPSGDPSSKLKCTGKEWNTHVDVKNVGTGILRDIANCSLPRVSWSIPNGPWSDHASTNDDFGPSWVASVVNAIGKNPKCPLGTADAGQTFWQNTAIVVTWDDWGGWSDNQPPPLLSKLPCSSSACQGDYQYGFRVPLLVISAYTPAGYIDNNVLDFGSILRMIEGVNHLTEGQLGFADRRATNDLHGFFPLTTPRTYKGIPAMKSASFFLGNTTPAIDPDDE